MTPTALTLLLFIVWMIVLLTLLGGLRASLSLTGKRAANDFDPGGTDVSPFSGRLCRVHANCYESLPAFASRVGEIWVWVAEERR